MTGTDTTTPFSSTANVLDTSSTRISLQSNVSSVRGISSTTTISTNSVRTEHPNDAVDSPIISNSIEMGDLIYCYRDEGSAPKAVLPFAGVTHTDLRLSAIRSCMLRSWKLADPKVREIFRKSSLGVCTDNVVFPVPPMKVKNGISIADTKLVKCSNLNCTQKNEDGKDVPVQLHYCCYLNMLHKNKTNHIQYDENKDHAFTADQVGIMETMKDKIEGNDIVLPVCGKHCHDTLLKLRELEKGNNNYNNNNAKNRKASSGAVEQWDNDARDGSMTSEHVIVEWLTSNENAEKYFGGNHGPKGGVNGVCKDVYHTRLSNMIRQENGQLRLPHLVKSKIEHILTSYKNVHDIVEQSGGRLENAEYKSFMKYIHKCHCKWYSVLHEVLSSRPNIQPAYTNEAEYLDDNTNCDSERDGADYDNSILLAESTSDEDQLGRRLSDLTSSAHSNGSSSKSSSSHQSNGTCNGLKVHKAEKGTTTKITGIRKLLVLQAAKIKKEHKKNRLGSSRSNAISIGADEHFEKMFKVQEQKIKSQANYQEASLAIEHSRLTLEKDKMGRESVMAKLQQEKLKGEIMKEIIEYNYEVSKKRRELKEDDKKLTDKRLDIILPYRKPI